MKPPFAAKTRTRVARWAMEQVRAFVALIAPWLALAGDRPMSRMLLATLILLLVLGLATAGIGVVEGVQAVVVALPRRTNP